MRPSIKEIFLVALSLVAVGAAALYTRENKDILPSYTLYKVDRGKIVKTVSATGQLTPLVSVEVSSQISGLVIEVAADFNGLVKRGQVLARLDPSTYEQQLSRAEADLESARAAYELSILDEQRQRDLFLGDVVSRQDYDRAIALRRQSKAELLIRQAAVRNARVDLVRCTITSPIDGIVIYRQVEVGKTIAASFSAPTLFVIAPSLSKMRIIAPINEADIWSIKVGMRVSFTVDALSDRHFEGVLVQIRNPYFSSEKQPGADRPRSSSVTSFDGVIEVDNRDLVLRPSLTANVSILVEDRTSVLRIPNGALRVKIPEHMFDSVSPGDALPKEENEIWAMVYRLPAEQSAARPQAVNVRLGITDGVMTEVLSGLRSGETIVTGFSSKWEQHSHRLFE